MKGYILATVTYDDGRVVRQKLQEAWWPRLTDQTWRETARIKDVRVEPWKGLSSERQRREPRAARNSKAKDRQPGSRSLPGWPRLWRERV